MYSKGSNVQKASVKTLQQQLRETIASNTQLYGLQDESSEGSATTTSATEEASTDFIEYAVKDIPRHRRTESKGGLSDSKISDDSPVKQLACLQVRKVYI